MNDLEIIVTADGSHSLLNRSLNETYHSNHGAVQESLHVFIENGLKFYCRSHPKNDVRIFEVGFGTGLNVLLTLKYNSVCKRKVHYTSIELNPLTADIWTQLNYSDSDETRKIFASLHEASWEIPVEVASNFILEKVACSLESFSVTQSRFDVVYFDAFAPNKQPEMWTLPVLTKVTSMLSEGGVFVTYCAKGQLKRDLKSLGLVVETLPGPPGKKEMVRAIRQ